MERSYYKKIRSFGCTRYWGKDFKHHARSTHNDRKLEAKLIRRTLQRQVMPNEMR